LKNPISEDAGLLILVADDDMDTRELYGYYLRERGYRIAVAGDGEEALNKSTELRPDLIVMDLSMPKLDGEAASRILKSDANTNRIPIVLLTGHANDGPYGVQTDNCDGRLIKPCSPKNLLEEILRVLALRYPDGSSSSPGDTR
jgi:two-component system phosphate regulon response regulator PhoB